MVGIQLWLQKILEHFVSFKLGNMLLANPNRSWYGGCLNAQWWTIIELSSARSIKAVQIVKEEYDKEYKVALEV